MTRGRIPATVDDDLLHAGRRAVDEGRAPSLSAWVNEALQRQADHDRRMVAMDEFLTAYEAEHGVIGEQEMLEAQRWARTRATVVGPALRPSRRRAAG